MTVDPLGPFQRFWDVWDEAHDQMIKKSPSYFREVAALQFVELEEHWLAGNTEAAAREAVDIISVALNCLRWLRYRPEGVAELALAAAKRPAGGQRRTALGPFQLLWDGLDDGLGRSVEQSLPGFRQAVARCFAKLEKHWLERETVAAARDAVGIISVALNCLRWLGYGPENVAELASCRAEVRMRGKTQAILHKYQHVHGV